MITSGFSGQRTKWLIWFATYCNLEIRLLWKVVLSLSGLASSSFTLIFIVLLSPLAYGICCRLNYCRLCDTRILLEKLFVTSWLILTMMWASNRIETSTCKSLWPKNPLGKLWIGGINTFVTNWPRYRNKHRWLIKQAVFVFLVKVNIKSMEGFH